MNNLWNKLTVYERTMIGVFVALTLLLAAADAYLMSREAVHIKVVKSEPSESE